MKRILLILILLSISSHATVEDLGGGMSIDQVGTDPNPSQVVFPGSVPSPCSGPSSCLSVAVSQTGPGEPKEKGYLTQGKTMEFLISVMNEGRQEVTATLGVSSQKCPLEWFSWLEESLVIPAGATRSKSLLVSADTDAAAGSYDFTVDATSSYCKSNSGKGAFKIQALDYASETAISGTGQFRLNKNIRSMNSGVKSTKDILFSGSVDALVKNEYLVDGSRGKNPNFEARDAVDNYQALYPGDSLVGTESIKSSAVFGGVGAKLQEKYDLMQMEFESQSFNLHQTGSLKKSAEFKTADNFTGFYLIDAKQAIPGQRNLAEHEEYLGSFEISRKIVFRNEETDKPRCAEGGCENEKETEHNSRRRDDPSCSSFEKFDQALGAFSQSAQ
jgi:hypothetical protein